MSHPFGVVTLWEFGDPERVRDVVHERHARSGPAQRARAVCRAADSRTRRNVLAARAISADARRAAGALRTVLGV